MTEDDSPLDPATIARKHTETQEPDAPVLAVGVGPGNPAYCTPRAQTAIRTADVVTGFATVVDLIADRITGDVLACGYDTEATQLDRFAERMAAGDSGTAVFMGDPNHSGYQLLGRIEDRLDRPVRVVPGISSIQIAASRARTPLEESTFVTLHKRGSLASALERLASAVDERNLLVLPRPTDWMPETIAAWLIDQGATPSLEALVCERLTFDDERIHESTLAGLAGAPRESAFTPCSVVVVRQPVGDP